MNNKYLKNKFLSDDCATRTHFKMGDNFTYIETFQPGYYASRFLEVGAFVRNAQFTDDFGNKLGKNGNVQEIISRQVFVDYEWRDVKF